MKNRMRELNLKMTELAEYLKVSRPTLYKYIDSYETGDTKSIPKDVLVLFNYMSREGVTKEQVVSFAIMTFNESDELDMKGMIKKYVTDASDKNQKLELIYKLISTDVLDDLVPYFNNCVDILSEGPADEKQMYQVARMINLKSNVTKNTPLSEEELDMAKDLLGDSYGKQ